jgi:hypothetical protein
VEVEPAVLALQEVVVVLAVELVHLLAVSLFGLLSLVVPVLLRIALLGQAVDPAPVVMRCVQVPHPSSVVIPLLRPVSVVPRESALNPKEQFAEQEEVVDDTAVMEAYDEYSLTQ